jgi:D-alanine-D-alanine ligase
MPDNQSDLSQFVLSPSPHEIRDTEVLFHTRHATDLTEERKRRFGYTVVYHEAILTNLRGLGLNVTTGSDPEMLFRKLDFDYIWFTQIEDQFQGHELLIPAVAAMRGIAFLGPSAPVRALSEDKILAKALAASLGVEVAKHRIVGPATPGLSDLSLPGRWILKPRTGVMSEHLVFIDGEAGWPAALGIVTDPRHHGREFIAERFVPGLNLTVPVIEGFPLQSFPVFVERGESRNNILTEAGKEGHSPDYMSEPYSGPGAAEASAAAARLAAAIAPFDYARFDFRFDPEQSRLVFLEVNMNCAMGPAAVVSRAAELRGLNYRTLVGHVFTHSLRRQAKAR